MKSRHAIILSTISWMIPLSVASPIFYVSDQGSTFNSIDSVTTAGLVSTFATGLNAPDDITVDKNGDIFEADKGSGNVFEFTPGGMKSTVANLGSGTFPEGIAVDGSGNVYVTLPLTGVIDKISNGSVTNFATVNSSSAPSALAFDASGNLYVAGFNNGTIYKVTPGGTVTTFATGLDEPQGLAFNSSGTLFETDWGSGTVNEISSTGVVTPFATGLSQPYGLTFDSTGNLYVTTTGNNQAAIYEFTSGGTKTTFVAPTTNNTVLGDPVSIAFFAGTTVGATPEPSTWLAAMTGLGFIVSRRYRRSNRQA